MTLTKDRPSATVGDMVHITHPDWYAGNGHGIVEYVTSESRHFCDAGVNGECRDVGDYPTLHVRYLEGMSANQIEYLYYDQVRVVS